MRRPAPAKPLGCFDICPSGRLKRKAIFTDGSLRGTSADRGSGSGLIGAGRRLRQDRDLIEAALPVGLAEARSAEEQFGVGTGLVHPVLAVGRQDRNADFGIILTVKKNLESIRGS